MLGWPVCCLSVHRFPVNLSLLLSVFCEVLIKSCDQVCSVFPDSETAVLWLQCVSCVPPPCLTSWRVWRAQAGWSTSKLFWMQASSSPRSVWRLILTVCLTVALNIGLGVGLFTRSPWGFPPDLHEWATTTDRWSGYHIYHLITMYSGPSFIMGVTF